MDMDMDMDAKIQRYRDTCIHGHALKATMGVTIAEWKRGCVKCINFNPQVLPLQPLWEMVGFLGVRVNGKIPRIDWGTPLKFFSVVKDLLMKLSFPIFPHPRADKKVTSLNMHSWVLFQNISLPISSSLTRKKSSWKLTWNLKITELPRNLIFQNVHFGGFKHFSIVFGLYLSMFRKSLPFWEVIAWGHPHYGGNSGNVDDRLRNVEQLQATGSAFCAILADETVVTWGDAENGGDSSEVQEELKPGSRSFGLL